MLSQDFIKTYQKIELDGNAEEIFTFAENFKKNNVNNNGNGKGNDIENGNANNNRNLNDNVNDDVFAVINFSGFRDFFLQCKEEE